MRKILKEILLITIMMVFILSIAMSTISEATSSATANLKTYSFKAEEKLQDSGFETGTNQQTLTNITPSTTYDFIDEDGLYNSVFTSSENVYWRKYDKNMEIQNEYTWPLYYRKSQEDIGPNLIYQDLTENFGNAIYDEEEGYLYVLYARAAISSRKTTENVMAIGKYDKNGNEVLVKEYLAEHLSQDYVSEGTWVPFYGSSNCSLAISDGRIACLFGRHMFSGHDDSLLAFFDVETLDHVSDLIQGEVSLEDRHKYYKIYDHSIPHSMGQRIITTSDGNFLLAEEGDGGVYGSTRGLVMTKIFDYYDEETGWQTLNETSVKMYNVSEGGPDTYGYNSIYSMLGEVIELSDGYLYAGAMEKTLSRKYGYYINEERNLFVQKYKKDFYEKKTAAERQILDTEVRETSDEPSTYNGYGRLYLTGNEKDYGIKWLTDLNEKAVNIIRIVKLENDNVAILWEETQIQETTFANKEREKAYSPYNVSNRTAYYMIIDKDANVIQKATELPGVNLSIAEKYPYKDGKIYWTTTKGTDIKVNVLDVSNKEITSKGDINADGKINARDAKMALQYFTGKINLTAEQQKVADVNEDNKINARDAKLILQYFTGKIKIFKDLK